MTKKENAKNTKNSSVDAKNENVKIEAKKEKTIFSNEILTNLNSIEIKENAIRKKDFLYKFQLENENLSEKETKKLRSKLRTERARLINNILINAKLNKVENLTECKKLLLEFQNKNLINQNFKLESFYQGSEDKTKKEIETAILICESLEN